MSPDELLRIAKEIKTFNATVFVAFTGADPLKQLAKYLEQENVTGKTWIASEAWASSRTVQAAGRELVISLAITEVADCHRCLLFWV